MNLLRNLFSSGQFMPHGHCYLWTRGLVALHVWADALVALAYYSIPFTLLYFAARRKDLKFQWIFVCFSVFILACGTTHLVEIWNIWHGYYWLAGGVKAITAMASVMTAILLVKLVPHALALPSAVDLQNAHDNLEIRVQQRTAELAKTTGQLKTEIADRKLTEEQLLATVKEIGHLRSALDVHAIVVMTDPEGRITSVNDKFCAISKYSRTELLGQNLRFLSSGFHPKEFFMGLSAAISRGEIWQGEIQNRAKDGSLYWVATTIVPFADQHGKPFQFLEIQVDITQRKADEANLVQLAAELAEKNKELEAIVYTVSHDLRSPLVNVQGFGKQLLSACESIRDATTVAGEAGSVPVAKLVQPVSVTIPRALQFINAGVTKLDSLLTGMLRYSRLGRVELTIQPVDMDQLIGEIIGATRFQLEEVQAEVRVEPLPACLSDREQTSQVFANLLDNAVKYRDPARPLRITISGIVDDGIAIYAVADNGLGIAPEDHGKVFEIFQRLNPNSIAGEGLGLTIAQRVLARQRGHVWIERRPGPGTTFLVSLPAVETGNTPHEAK